jgi:MFS family permease
MRTRVALYTALLIAGLVTAFTIRYASFTPWASDTGSYVHAARRWAERDLFAPEAFHMWPRWSALGVPLGNRHSAISATYVTVYPLGFPMFLAVGDLVDRDLGVYLIPPIFAGLLVLATFAIARRIAPDWAALLAAVLMALSPIVLANSVLAMSDVPAAALVMLAIAMSIRASTLAAAAAGACVAAAVMTRPVLAPLGIVPFFLLLTGAASRVTAWREWQWRHAAMFLLVAAIGPAMLAWSQLVLYGGALKTGYLGVEGFFSRDRIAVNAVIYPRNLIALHSPFIFLGLAAVVPLYYTQDQKNPIVLRIIITLIALVLINYALYLPYLVYEEIWFTRFMLPAQAALFILLAAAVAYAVTAVSRLATILSIVCVVPALIVMYEGTKLYRDIFAAWPGQVHARLMIHYLREALPRNAAVISFLHSGAIAHYTGRQVVRFDFMSRADADIFIEALVQRRYRPVFVIDQENEWGFYNAILAGTKYQRLDWPLRAKASGGLTMWYLDLSDRNRPRDQLQPLDVLR